MSWTDVDTVRLLSNIDPTEISDEQLSAIIELAETIIKRELPSDFDYETNLELLKIASSYYSAYLAMVKLRGKLPIRYTLGRLRIVDPVTGKNFYEEYRRCLALLRRNEAISSEIERDWRETLLAKEERGTYVS